MKLTSLGALIFLTGIGSSSCTVNESPARTRPAEVPVSTQQSESPTTPPAAARAPERTETLELPPLVLEREKNPPREPDVVFVPTPQVVVDKMLELARVKSTDLVYDLGCGDGRIVVTAAKRYGVRAVGFDIDPERVAEAKANVKQAGVEHLVTIEERDIFELDLSPADVVTLYLLPELNVRLIPQLKKLKPGSRIVSHDFDMAGVKPERVVPMRPPGEADHTVYFWRAPIRLQGETAKK
jgi:SAM-dependent methyltransferase